MNEKEQGTLTEQDSLYLKEYQKYMTEIPDLDEDKEKILIEKAIKSDEEAQARLIASYMKKTIKVALQEINKGVSLKRLIECGNIGIVMAVEKLSDVESSPQMIMDRMKQYIENSIRTTDCIK